MRHINTTNNKKRNVFLGGTCNNSTWRDELIPKLELLGITYFNPVVDDWNEEAKAIEDWHKEHDDICLYVLTKEMTGCYSVAEVVQDSNNKPHRTIFCIVPNGFTKGQLKSLEAVKEIVANNGAYYCEFSDLPNTISTALKHLL